MQTEQAEFTPRTAPQLVALALQDLGPLSVSLTDSRDRPVPLSSAGFVLHAGARYRLRVLLPRDPDLTIARISIAPEFIRVGDFSIWHDPQGRSGREYPVRVSETLRSFGVVCDELDLEVGYRAESNKPTIRVPLPIVIRPGLIYLLAGACTAILTVVLPILLGEILASKEESSTTTKVVNILQGPIPWIIGASVLAATLALCGSVFYQLRLRARELHKQFAERYPEVSDDIGLES